MRKFVHYGHREFDKNMFEKISNSPYFRTKPEGGLWASDVEAKYGWKDWCKAENFRDCTGDNSFKFVLTDDARVLSINLVNDLEELPQVEDGFSISTWVTLDFEKLSKMYDVIEVNISNDWDLYFSLYGWDCDSIVVMNPEVIREVGE